MNKVDWSKAPELAQYHARGRWFMRDCFGHNLFVHYDQCGFILNEDPKEDIASYSDYQKRPDNNRIKTMTTNKYKRIVKGAEIDVYDVLMAWNVTNPALQHLIKKALQAGNRGHKDLETDLQDIIDSAVRAKELGA